MTTVLIEPLALELTLQHCGCVQAHGLNILIYRRMVCIWHGLRAGVCFIYRLSKASASADELYEAVAIFRSAAEMHAQLNGANSRSITLCRVL